MGGPLLRLATLYPEIGHLEGWESDGECVAWAQNRAQAEGLSRRILLRQGGAEALMASPPGRWDVLIACDGLWQNPTPARQLRAIAHALAPGGRCLLLDYVLGPGPDAAGKTKQLRSVEPAPLALVSWAGLEALCQQAGLAIQARDDLSASWRQHVAGLMATYLGRIDEADLAPPVLNPLTAEVERWSLRLAGLDEHSLRYLRLTLQHRP